MQTAETVASDSLFRKSCCKGRQAISEWPCSCDLHLRLHLQLDSGLELGRSVGSLETMVNG